MEIIKISWEVKWILCLHDLDSKEKRNIARALHTILNRLKICNILYFNWFGPSVIGLLWLLRYTQVLGCLFFRLSGMPLFCQKIGKVSSSSDRFTTPTHLFLFVTRSLYRVSQHLCDSRSKFNPLSLQIEFVKANNPIKQIHREIWLCH